MYKTPQPLIKEICKKFTHDAMDSHEIAEWMVLTGKYQGNGNLDSVASLVRKILYRYRASLEIDKHYEEVSQIVRIKRRINKSKETRKDVYDWESLLDNKITPKKVEHSGKIDGADTKIIIVRDSGDKAKKVSGRVSVQRA